MTLLQWVFKRVVFRIARIRAKVLLPAIGRGSIIGPLSEIRGRHGIMIGEGFFARRLLWIEAVTQHAGISFPSRITIGNRVACSVNVHIAAIDKVSIGDDVLIGSNVLITDHDHGTYSGSGVHDNPAVIPNARSLSSHGPVEIGDRVWIGDGVAILSGTVIPAGCIVAACSVIKGSYPPNCILAGAPARVVKQFLNGQWTRVDKID